MFSYNGKTYQTIKTYPIVTAINNLFLVEQLGMSWTEIKELEPHERALAIMLAQVKQKITKEEEDRAKRKAKYGRR